ncbi:hypothetical protein D3C78_1481130 [compost metagenome]
MGLGDILRAFGDGKGVEPDRRAFLGQAPVDDHAVARLFGAIAELVETAGVADGDANIAIGDVGHVLGGVEVGDVRANLQHQRLGFFVVIRVLAVGVQPQVMQGQRQDFRG